MFNQLAKYCSCLPKIESSHPTILIQREFTLEPPGAANAFSVLTVALFRLVFIPKQLQTNRKIMQGSWNSSSVCVMKTVSPSKSSCPPSRCSAAAFLHKMWNAFHLVLWRGSFCHVVWKIAMGKQRKLCATAWCYHYLFQCNCTASYSTSHPAKIRWGLKMPWGQSIYIFNGWKRPFLQTSLKKKVLSVKTMKRVSPPPTHFSCGHLIIMPLSVPMPSTATAAFPGKDSFPALTEFLLHSWPVEAFCRDEITHRMSPGYSFLHLQVLI